MHLTLTGDSLNLSVEVNADQAREIIKIALGLVSIPGGESVDPYKDKSPVIPGAWVITGFDARKDNDNPRFGGGKIRAIKLVRELGVLWGLKEAKDFVESVSSDNPWILDSRRLENISETEYSRIVPMLEASFPDWQLSPSSGNKHNPANTTSWLRMGLEL